MAPRRLGSLGRPDDGTPYARAETHLDVGGARVPAVVEVYATPAERMSAMTAAAGVVRNGAGLARVTDSLVAPPPADHRDTLEVRNLVEVGRALVAAAAAREESRGCHTRSDFPDASPAFERRQRSL